MPNEVGVFSKLLFIALENSAQDIADAILFQADENLREGDFSPAKGAGAFDRGTLARSGRVEGEGLVRYVIYDAPHAKWIEYGTRPHHPPFKPIFEWVKRKIGISAKGRKYGTRSRKVTSIRHIIRKIAYRNIADRSSEAVSVTWAIINKIAKVGTPPRPFFRRAIHAVEPRMVEIVQENINKELRK